MEMAFVLNILGKAFWDLVFIKPNHEESVVTKGGRFKAPETLNT